MTEDENELLAAVNELRKTKDELLDSLKEEFTNLQHDINALNDFRAVPHRDVRPYEGSDSAENSLPNTRKW